MSWTQEKDAKARADFKESHSNLVASLGKAQEMVRANGMRRSEKALRRVISSIVDFDTPEKWLGWIGGNTPVKPGSRPRGRPRKER